MREHGLLRGRGDKGLIPPAGRGVLAGVLGKQLEIAERPLWRWRRRRAAGEQNHPCKRTSHDSIHGC
jgi:hypothetical protein